MRKAVIGCVALLLLGVAAPLASAQSRKLTDADYRKLEEALGLFEKAAELDPKSALNDFYILTTYNLLLQYWMTKRDEVPPEEVKRVDEEIDRILDKMRWIRPSPLDDRLLPGFRPGELIDAPVPKKRDTPVGVG